MSKLKRKKKLEKPDETAENSAHAGSAEEESLVGIVREDLDEAIAEERRSKRKKGIRRRRKNAATPDEKARKAFRKLTDEEDDYARPNVSLRTILGGDILGGRWFRKQFWYIVMVVIMCIIYVSNRYYCQQEMIEGTKLADTLKDRHIKALTAESQLKEMTSRSTVEEHLADTTLKPPVDRIYQLAVEPADTAAEETATGATP